MIYIRSYNFQGDSQWSFSITYRYRVYTFNWIERSWLSIRNETRKGSQIGKEWPWDALVLGGYRWREISGRQSRSILHGILFGWRGKPWLKAVESAVIRTHGEGYVATKNWKRSTKVFFRPFSPRFACLKIWEREKNYRFLPWKREVTRILSDYFFFLCGAIS